jgi:hypothetical protein
MTLPSRTSRSVTLTPTVPRDLNALYTATAAARPDLSLPTRSHLLAAAMRAQLVALGIDVDLLAPAPPTRTAAATAARSRARLARRDPSGDPGR